MKKKSVRVFDESQSALSKSQVLFEAIMANDDDTANVISAMKDVADLNTPIQGQLPLECAIAHNKLERFKAIATMKPMDTSMADLNATIVVGRTKITMSLLHYAAKLGRSGIVKFMLAQGLDPSMKDHHPRQFLPIHYAASSGDKNTVDVLNINNAACAALSGYGDSPLHIAAERGKNKIVEYLVNLGANINGLDNANRTPLHHAAKRGHLHIVDFLLKQGASRNHCDSLGRNAYLYAVESGNIKLIELLVPDGYNYAYRDNEGVSATHLAAQANDVDTLLFLTTKDGLSLTAQDSKMRRPLHFAAEAGAEHVFDLILRGLIKSLKKILSKPFPNKFPHEKIETMAMAELPAKLLTWQDDEGNTVIEYAVRGNAAGIVHRLISLGVNLNRTNRSGCTPLHEVAKTSFVSMMNTLRANGVPIDSTNAQGRQPVHYAAEFGQVVMLNAFKQLGTVDFTVCDQEGIQPIHLAASSGQRDVIDWLVDNTPNTLGQTDLHGRNALFHAVRENQEELITYLVKDKKMSLNTTCSKGLTVMHHAVFKGAINAIMTLKKLGVSLEIPNKLGMTPFHLACRSGIMTMVEFLATQGVDVNMRNNLGRNAWFYAAAQQGLDLFHCLEKLGVQLAGITDNSGMTPLHIAAMGSNLAAVRFFCDKGFSHTAMDNKQETPLVKTEYQRDLLLKKVETLQQHVLIKGAISDQAIEHDKVKSRLSNCINIITYLSKKPIVQDNPTNKRIRIIKPLKAQVDEPAKSDRKRDKPDDELMSSQHSRFGN